MYGPRYFGDGGGVVVAPPVSTGQTFTRRPLRRLRIPLAIRLEMVLEVRAGAVLHARESALTDAGLNVRLAPRMRLQVKALSVLHAESHGGDPHLWEYNEADELAILGLL